MTIILTILKIIGKAVLWILVVLVFLILLILVCPVCYEIKGEKQDQLSIEGKIKLLLGIVSIRFNSAVGGKTDAGIYILGKKLGNRSKRKNSREEQKRYEEAENRNLIAAEADNAENIDLEAEEDAADQDLWMNQEPQDNEPAVRKVKLSDTEKALRREDSLSGTRIKRLESSEDKKKKTEVKNDASERNNNDKKKDKEEPQELNAQYFIKMPKEERKILIKAVIKLLKSLLKGIKPNNFYLIGTVGLSDPALTGEVVGAAWVLNGILNKRIEISAVFDRKVIEGKAYMKGHIIPAYMLFCMVRFALVKPVRKIIKLLLKGSGDKNGKRNRKQS